jgi:putative transposase
MKSERHFLATLNYVHHNAVHHGYVEHWQDWPWSSASEFLEQVGHERAKALWKKYPILDYGKKWDLYVERHNDLMCAGATQAKA